MIVHHPLWTSPQPLWGRFGASVGGSAFGAQDQPRPAILRFASDQFMEELLAMLAEDPRRVGGLVARPESWRNPMEEPESARARARLPRAARALARLRSNGQASSTLPTTSYLDTVAENGFDRPLPLKLYQPAHQRFYLVAASLVCGVAGLPERAIGTGGREQVGFVLRRLLPAGSAPEPREEYAFIKDAAGARWQRVQHTGPQEDPAAIWVEGEELLPLFPMSFRDEHDHPRRMLAGLVPVGRREEYMSTVARATEPPTGNGAVTAMTIVTERKEQLKRDVTEPWKNLVRTAYAAAERITTEPADDSELDTDKQEAAARAVNRQLQVQSWLLLLDFADFLATHTPKVWQRIRGQPVSFDITGQQTLYDALTDAGTRLQGVWPIRDGDPPWPAAGEAAPVDATSLADALSRAYDARTVLEGATGTFPADPGAGLHWPGFTYLLAGVRRDTGFKAGGAYDFLRAVSAQTLEESELPPVGRLNPDPTKLRAFDLAEADALLLDQLVRLVIGAIDTTQTALPAAPLPFAVRLRDALASTAGDEGWFVLRCAYLRCDCGPLKPTVMSAASQRFQLASFFDPDAPARPIRIALPLDTTPAGLRKHDKNAAFVISDVLCGQVQRAKGLGLIDLVLSVLPWPLHKDLDLGGMGPCKNGNQDTIGMICSLSIPIVTLCALILLLIIVSLLDFIFRWMPWVILCFPIKGLKGKKA